MCPEISAQHRQHAGPLAALLVRAARVAPVAHPPQLHPLGPRVDHVPVAALAVVVLAVVAASQAAGTSLCTTHIAFRRKS